MAETTDQVKAEIAQTREDLGETLDQITSRVDATRRRIPFYGDGAPNRQLLMVAGSLIVAASVIFLTFYIVRRID